MTKSDDAILEYLNDTGLALPPRAISYNMQTRENADISYTTVNRRLKQLLNQTLVTKEYEKGGFYSITERGQKYLNGELSKSDLTED
jgi:CTP-dependent riboflavin kinase